MLALWYAPDHALSPRRADTPQVQEISIDYTNCITDAPLTEAVFNASQRSTLEDIPKGDYSATFKSEMKAQPQWGRAWEDYTWPSSRTQNTTVCILSFEIPNDIQPPILFYYRLTNFYQNHRRYVKSVDIEQLKGSAVSAGSISGDCSPLDLAPDGRPYYPCGLIANSMFNDTFTSLNASNPQREEGSAENPEYKMTEDGTSWSHEGDLYGKTKYKPSEVVPPPFWQDRFVNGSYDSLNELPDLHTWEPFQVWMRTAGLPTFSKLAQRNDNDVLKAGTYRLKIYDRTLAPPALVPTFCGRILTPRRFPRQGIQRHQVDSHFDTHRHGWQEPLPRHCVHCRGRSLPSAWCCLPRHSPHQAQVRHSSFVKQKRH